MKRFILSMAMLLAVAVSTMAMSYEQARDRALFLTDKMAYELNLNDEQYEAAYEVNLDYLMSINTYDDLYGTYWTRRNLDLSYILMDWQYDAFCSAAYFYRPLVWTNGVWRFSIYARYPHRTYFYFGRPAFYTTYCGGHSWRMNGGRSWYHGRTFGPRPGESRFGMRDRFDRGDFKGSRNHGGFDRRNDRGPGRNDNGNFNGGRRNDRNNNDGFNNRRPGRNDNSGFNGRRPNDNGNYSDRNDSQNNRGNNRGNSGFSGIRRDNNGNRGTMKRADLGNERTKEITRIQSSTRETVNRPAKMNNDFSSSSSRRSIQRESSIQNSRPASTFSPSRSMGGNNGGSNRSFNSNGGGRSNGGGHFGGRR